MTSKALTLSEKKRLSIVEAALNCFQTLGVNATSMDKIAELAGVSKRTVYNHFESKETLVSELLSNLWNRLNTNDDFEYQKNEDLLPQLTEALKRAVDVLGEEQYISLARIGVGHFLFNESDFPENLKALVQQESYLEKWISHAIADGKLVEVDTEKASNYLYSLIKGNAHWPQVLKMKPLLSETEKETLAKDSASLFLNTYAK